MVQVTGVGEGIRQVAGTACTEVEDLRYIPLQLACPAGHLSHTILRTHLCSICIQLPSNHTFRIRKRGPRPPRTSPQDPSSGSPVRLRRFQTDPQMRTTNPRLPETHHRTNHHSRLPLTHLPSRTAKPAQHPRFRCTNRDLKRPSTSRKSIHHMSCISRKTTPAASTPKMFRRARLS